MASQDNAPNNNDGTRERGFQKMQREDPEQLSRIASQGGKSAHEQNKAHEWSSEEAARAGELGGKRRAENRQNAQNEEGGSEMEM